MAKFIFPSVLSFSRSIQPTIGYLYSVKSPNSADDKPVIIEQETLRTTFSNYGEREKITKLVSDEKAGTSNIQTVEAAYVSKGYSWLKAAFSVSFLCNSLQANSTNDFEASNKLEKLVELYLAKETENTLAKAYLTNIVSGRWFFRNDYGQNKLVTISGDIDGAEFSETFVTPKRAYDMESALESNKEGFERLTALVHQGLFDPRASVQLKVEGFIQLSEGAEVFPSQEFAQDAKTRDGQRLSKVLSSITLDNGSRQATFHSQKIGNALRTIDSWYEDAEYSLPVEPFGIDQRLSLSQRAKGNDFYTLVEKNLETWIEEIPKSTNVNELPYVDSLHFVIACLVRGGVYSGDSKKAKKTKKA